MKLNPRLAALLLAVSLPVGLAGCGDDGVLETIESALPSITASAPGTGEGESGNESGNQESPAQTDQPEPTDSPETAEPAPVETPEESEPATPTEESSDGLPGWAWLLIIGGGIALIAAIVAASRRGSGGNERDLAAQADGQLSWVRNEVTDPLVRWRAGELGKPADQRDTDSPQAKTWALVEQRLTAASNDLLTMQSGAKDDSVRQAAGMLQQAADGYRNSLDALTQSVAAGDQARISQASQAFQADTALFDQGRQRLQQVMKL